MVMLKDILLSIKNNKNEPLPIWYTIKTEDVIQYIKDPLIIIEEVYRRDSIYMKMVEDQRRKDPNTKMIYNDWESKEYWLEIFN